MKSAFVVAVLALGLVAVSCKKSGPELTCKVNNVCFVCPDEAAQAKCVRDPSVARCKYAEMTHCK